MITEQKKQEVMSGQKTDVPVTWQEMRTLFKMEQQPQAPKKTWGPTAGGILAIVAGYFEILMGIGMFYVRNISTFSGLNSTLVVTSAIVLLALGAYSVIGGSLAIGRRAWGWALAGSITATIVPAFLWVPGILSLIWTGLGKSEFRK